MAKAWLQERWVVLTEQLQGLTIDNEAEIERICTEEKALWRARPSIKSLSSLKEPMTDTRNEIRRFPFNERTRWFNPKTQEHEHIFLKHMNWTEEEWKSMNKPSEDKLKKRLQSVKLIDHPDQVVEIAIRLLASQDWVDVALGLSVLTGRRLGEIMKVGNLQPKTMYTVLFSGQLKRKDVTLESYEIPILAQSSIVLEAWSRLRTLRDCSGMDGELIGKTYDTELSQAATRYYSEYVPAREGRVSLYTHLFRTIYPQIAVLWFCPVTTSPLEYIPTIQGHYWEKDGQTGLDYKASIYYADYNIGDGHGNVDGRRGLRLNEPGVVVLDAFNLELQPIEEPETVKAREVETPNPNLQLTKQTKTKGSLISPKSERRADFDKIKTEAGIRSDDDALILIFAEYRAMQELRQYTSSIDALRNLLQDALKDSEKPVEYLQEMLSDKRTFKQSYEKRGKNKNYSTLTTSELQRTHTMDAATEKWRRAVDAIIAYNNSVESPELRWYINPAVIVDLVGGKPAIIATYLKTRPDVQAHHEKYDLKVGYNRRAVNIKERVTVPETAESEAQ